MKKTLTPEFIRFLVVGVISALIEFTLFYLFKKHIDYKVANIPAFVITNIFTFILSRRYVFGTSKTNSNRYYELTLFIICLMGALAVNTIVLWALVEFGQMIEEPAKGIAIAVTVIWNFVTRKHIVFRNREVVPESSTPTKF